MKTKGFFLKCLILILSSFFIFSFSSSFYTLGWADDIHVSGAYAYVADSDSGLQVIDISKYIQGKNTNGICFINTLFK